MALAWTRGGVSWAGLWAGAGAWAINTQGSYALVPWVCAHGVNLTTPLACVLGIVALAGSLLSWRACRTGGGGLASLLSAGDGRPRLLGAAIGTAAGALFAVVIATQGAAGLVLNGCER